MQGTPIYFVEPEHRHRLTNSCYADKSFSHRQIRQIGLLLEQEESGRGILTFY